MTAAPTPRVLLWVPLPPPYAGPEVASELLATACRVHLPGTRIENASLRSSNMGKGRLDLEGLGGFARAYRRFVAGAAASDVVYLAIAANTIGCLRDAVLLGTAKLLGKRVVIHLRGGRYAEFYAGSGSLMKRVLRRSWGSASRAIVQTPRLRGALAEVAPHVAIEVVPNGLPEASFPPKASYQTHRPRILFVGHLAYSKGFYDLMRAARVLRERGRDFVLVCAGELPAPERSFADFLPAERQQEYLRTRHELCAEIHRFVTTEANVEYAGVVTGDAKRELFLSADLLVLPSYSEGFSLAILEAMFHGLPVVTTWVGGTPDIVRDGVNGRLVEPGNVLALVRALDELIGDAALRERMGRTNAREARARYELDVVARQLVKTLVDAVDRGTAAPTAPG